MNINKSVLTLGAVAFASALLLGCDQSTTAPFAEEVSDNLRVDAFRFRDSVNVSLNENFGWAAAENKPATIYFDEPFRFRAKVHSQQATASGNIIQLQYRWKNSAWTDVGAANFPYPKLASPVISAISHDSYPHMAETDRLLGDSESPWDNGMGLSGTAQTPVWQAGDEALEWEWSLVIRRFSDGPTFAANGSMFELRLVDATGQVLAAPTTIEVNAVARANHLGGTFVETPGRLGPYQKADGSLFFVMEPTETDNRFMVVKSADYGQTWFEVDGENRPQADDLEGVASVEVGSTIHFIHQQSREVFYHAFDTETETWRVDSESIAVTEEPATQYADVVARSDGSLVAMYASKDRLYLKIRSAEGNWLPAFEVDKEVSPELSGPALVVLPADRVTMAYTGRNGYGFIRHMNVDGTLTPRQTIATNLGQQDAENGAILPLVFLKQSQESLVVYRTEQGYLYARTFDSNGQLSDAVLISSMRVITNAVDSEQVGADVVIHDNQVHLLFIEQTEQTIYHAILDRNNIWSEPRPVVEEVKASWVRGSVHLNAAGEWVYGFVYDAGSLGGSGMNRYMSIKL